MFCQSSIASGENKRNHLREFLTEALFPQAQTRQEPAVAETGAGNRHETGAMAPTAEAGMPVRDAKTCISPGRCKSCIRVAELLSRYGFAYCKNHRGQCYFCGKIMWKGECVNCCLGHPELTEPIEDPDSTVWVGYYGTDESGDMLIDEFSPSLVEFLQRHSADLVASTLQSASHPIKKP